MGRTTVALILWVAIAAGCHRAPKAPPCFSPWVYLPEEAASLKVRSCRGESYQVHAPDPANSYTSGRWLVEGILCADTGPECPLSFEWCRSTDGDCVEWQVSEVIECCGCNDVGITHHFDFDEHGRLQVHALP